MISQRLLAYKGAFTRGNSLMGLQQRAALSTVTNHDESHLYTEDMGNGIVMFNLNRGRARNALSKQLIDEF